jgi:shikimate 5-dehydrogenase
MIRGTTRLITLLGHPIDAVKAPMIYNPYFEHHGFDAVVMPMGWSPRTFPPCCARSSASRTSWARWSRCRTR